MPLSAAPRCDKAASDADVAERHRSTRERLEATISGLGELEYLRQRQEVLVRSALDFREEERRVARSGSEENILLLWKQLVGPHLSVSCTLVSSDFRDQVGSASLPNKNRK